MRCQNLAYKAVMWIQILRIRFRVQNFGPIWICYQFKQNVENNSRGKKIFNKICFKAIKKYRHLKFNQSSLGMEIFCLYLYTFCLVYPFFPFVDSDPYSEYGSTKLITRIQWDPDSQFKKAYCMFSMASGFFWYPVPVSDLSNQISGWISDTGTGTYTKAGLSGPDPVHP